MVLAAEDIGYGSDGRLETGKASIIISVNWYNNNNYYTLDILVAIFFPYPSGKI